MEVAMKADRNSIPKAPHVLPFPATEPLFGPEDVKVPKERVEWDFVELQVALGILQKDMPKLEAFVLAAHKSDGSGIEHLAKWHPE
jgi:hypothetical protein